MSSFCTEVSHASLNKEGEELCGDNVAIVSGDDDVTIAVLADGLGSGVKASILSILTSKIISTMVANGMPLTECVAAVAATLPVCSVRQIAYSTFTIIRVTGNNKAEIIQFDNPRVVLLRDGKHLEFPYTTRVIEGKSIHVSELYLQEGDVFLAFSDGVEHAGVGHKLNFGWRRSEIVDFLEGMYQRDHSAHTFTSTLLEQCNLLYDGHPGDDATVCTLRIRRRAAVNLLIGPPENPADDEKMLSLFFGKSGRHVVCGGTTAGLVAAYLGVSVDANLPQPGCDPEIPPTARIKGVDLCTEGVITVSKVLAYAQQYLQGNCDYYTLRNKTDGASLLASILFETATDITFFVGRAINPAHQNPHLPIRFSIKMQIVQELIENLERMGKRARVSYF